MLHNGHLPNGIRNRRHVTNLRGNTPWAIAPDMLYVKPMANTAWLVAALALSLVVGCDGDRDAGNGDEDDECSACEDFDACTGDLCTDDGCEFLPLDDVAIGCLSAWTLARCDAGLVTEFSCPLGCESHGYDAFAACDPAEIGCPCGYVNIFDECEPDAIACLTNGLYIGRCVAAAELGTTHNMWRSYHCDEICTDAGLGPALTCTTDLNDLSREVCYCNDPCVPECPQGSLCMGGQCYEQTSSDPDSCMFDAECGWRMRCNRGGECEWAECTVAGHCGWCQRCEGYSCISCQQNKDGSCSSSCG